MENDRKEILFLPQIEELGYNWWTKLLADGEFNYRAILSQ